MDIIDQFFQNIPSIEKFDQWQGVISLHPQNLQVLLITKCYTTDIINLFPGLMIALDCSPESTFSVVCPVWLPQVWVKLDWLRVRLHNKN